MPCCEEDIVGGWATGGWVARAGTDILMTVAQLICKIYAWESSKQTNEHHQQHRAKKVGEARKKGDRVSDKKSIQISRLILLFLPIELSCCHWCVCAP